MEIKLNDVLQRELKGRDLKRVAKDCLIKQTTLLNWRDGTSPNLKQADGLLNLCRYLNLTLEELLFNKKDLITRNEVISQTIFRDNGSMFKITFEKVSNDTQGV